MSDTSDDPKKDHLPTKPATHYPRPRGPATALALPKLAMPSFSTAMDALASHEDGAVRAALAAFVQAFSPPSHGTRLSEAFARLDEGLALLNEDTKEAHFVIHHARESLQLLSSALDLLSEKYSIEHPLKNWASQHIQYGALLKIPADDSQSLMGLASAYLASFIDGRPIRKAYCKAITSAARSTTRDGGGKPQRSWQAAHNKHIKMIEGMDSRRLPPDTGDFQRDACCAYIWQATLPGSGARLGLTDARSLNLDAIEQVAGDLRDGLCRGNDLAIGVATGWLSGLSWPMAKRMPLTQPEADDWVIWLDIEQGCYHVNINPIVRNAVVAGGQNNYVFATKAYKRHFPATLAQALTRLREAHPFAATLGELTKTQAIPEEQAIGAQSDRALKISIARFYNARSAVSRSLGLSASMTALALGDFRRGPLSRMYYQVTSSQQMNSAQARIAELLGWGPIPSAPKDTPPVGANVVPHAEAIAAISVELAAQVEAHRPARRHTWQHVREFHNAFALYTAFLVSLGIMGRRRNATVIIGGIWATQSGLCGVHDKRTRSSQGTTTVTICPAVQDQLDNWMKHLERLLDRMTRLAVCDSDLVHHIQSVLSGKNVSMVFTINEAGKPEDCGSNHAYASVPKSMQVKSDSARHMWETRFQLEEVADALANAQARRSARWAPYWQHTSTLSGARLRMVIGSLQQRVLEQLGIRAVAGLRK